MTVGVGDQVDTGIAALRDSLAGIGWTPAEAAGPDDVAAGPGNEAEGEREYE